MPSRIREQFTTEVNPELLATFRTIASTEGRELEALIDEALADFVEKHKNAQPRPQVMAAYQSSHEKYSDLYTKLAE